MSSVRKNAAFLLLVQISTYVVPMLIVPWQTRVLTAEGFGRLSVAMAIIMYFVNLAQYGFDLTVTPQISVHRDDREKRTELFWTTLTAQILIAIAGFIALMALTFIVGRLADDRELLAIGYGTALGASLCPGWYMQGTEKLKLLSMVTLTSRVLSLPAMFLLVRTKSDIYWAMGINSAVTMGASVVILGYVLLRKEVGRFRTSVADIVAACRAGWQVFVAVFSVNFYAYTNTVVLGFVAGNVEAGYFAAADKLVKAGIGMITPLSNAAYPRISYLMHHARDDAMVLLRKLLAAQGTIMLAVSLTIFVSAPYAVKVLYGAHFIPTTDVLRWMAFLPLMAGLANIFGVQAMLPLGMKNQFSRILLSSGALNVVLIYFLATWFAAVGAAAAVLITQTAVVVAMAYTLHSKGVVQALDSR
ncbi:flippase [Paraburkholderia sp. Tr-20389]|uniref:flippase n=1 Tax=Paraburkholderia sp. Tr-20389 TaxID=2703903 RepID=UPI0019803C91|nr:flippase [Paraburkholderia sp. Tr-20389]MBN3753589.1 flippase [Paraburkholderia sp. Tr-20389]